MKREKDGLLKRIGFKLHLPKIGDFGGGTQEPEYRDKDGNVIPYCETKWAKLKKRQHESNS